MEGNQPDNEPPNQGAPQNNIIRRPISFFPGLFLHMMPQDILQESMNDETPDKPAKQDFIDSLEEITINQEMIDQKIACSICLDEFEKEERCIKLPCENPHYFHRGDNIDVCEGIKPWFKINHNCPVCRCDFPEEVKIINETMPDNVADNDTDNANNTDNAENELLNRFNQLLREDPIENILFPPLINQPNPINIQSFNIHQMIDDVIEQEEDRQLQEAIRSSLENN